MEAILAERYHSPRNTSWLYVGRYSVLVSDARPAGYWKVSTVPMMDAEVLVLDASLLKLK